MTEKHLLAMEKAIVRTVAYVDVFDYPLTAEEVHRYLVGVRATASDVRATLANGRLVPQRLARYDGYFTLPGREAIVELRRRRAVMAGRLWPWAIHYGQTIAGLPFVRMVAVTGSLAVDNVDVDTDIDYLIVTEHGRLWLCRALVILLVRLAARRGVVLCPNYFLSEQALKFRQQDLYTARELAQMVPIAGLATYQHLRCFNGWVADFLPNAHNRPRQPGTEDLAARPAGVRGQLSRLAERFLRTAAGDRLEQWEMTRKIRKFSRQALAWRANGKAATLEVDFCPNWCKGHFDGHGQAIIAQYQARLRTLELEADRGLATNDL